MSERHKQTTHGGDDPTDGHVTRSDPQKTTGCTKAQATDSKLQVSHPATKTQEKGGRELQTQFLPRTKEADCQISPFFGFSEIFIGICYERRTILEATVKTA